MSNNTANKDKIKAAAIRRKKQAEALRANLKRRKSETAAKPTVK
jgi:hypothetical protein